MDAQYTRCPHCKTVFRLTVAQLDTAHGRVRCGACLQVFPARQNLVRPVSKTETGSPSVAVKSAPVATPVPVPIPAPVPAPEASAIEVSDLPELPDIDQPVSTTESTNANANHGDASGSDWDLPDFDSAFSLSETPSPEPQPEAEPEEPVAIAVNSRANNVADAIEHHQIDDIPLPSESDTTTIAPPSDEDDLRFDDDNDVLGVADEPEPPPPMMPRTPTIEFRIPADMLAAAQKSVAAPSPVPRPAPITPQGSPIAAKPAAAPPPADPDDDFMNFEVRDDVPADTSALPPDWFESSPSENELAAFKPVSKPGGDFGTNRDEWKAVPTVAPTAPVNPPEPDPISTQGNQYWQGEHVYGLQEEPLPLPSERVTGTWKIEPLTPPADPQYFELPDNGPKWPWKGLALTAAALLLIVVLVTQIMWPRRAEWREDESLGPYVESICAQIDCELPPRRNVNKIALVQKPSVVKDERDPKKLKIDLLMQNNAVFEQAFPDIELMFTDIDGQTVATRRFQPLEYLGKDDPPTSMPSGVPIHISFTVIEPKPTVTGFEFNFLPANP
jgi:predicted Zn finger-like uncharacterized protein